LLVNLVQKLAQLKREFLELGDVPELTCAGVSWDFKRPFAWRFWGGTTGTKLGVLMTF
jgi:hypothetical protein